MDSRSHGFNARSSGHLDESTHSHSGCGRAKQHTGQIPGGTDRFHRGTKFSSWVELSEACSVGCFGRRCCHSSGRHTQTHTHTACTNTAAVAHRFFPAFLCFLSRFTRTPPKKAPLKTLRLKFHFPYDGGLHKTSLKIPSILATPPLRYVPLRNLTANSPVYGQIK